MDAVRQKAKRVGDIAVKCLYCHEGEVETVQRALSDTYDFIVKKKEDLIIIKSLPHKVENPPRVLFCHDSV